MSQPFQYGHTFVSLSPNTFLRIPPAESQSSGGCITKDPYLIIVTTWLNASPTYIKRYLRGFERLFPTSRVLLIIATSAHFLCQANPRRLAELQPAIDILKVLQPHQEVLLHTFSNGGATTAWQISTAYRAQTGKAMPITKAVLDSAPGRAEFRPGANVLASTLPASAFLRLLKVVLLRMASVIWYFLEKVTRSANIIELMRVGLNSHLLFTPRAARLYIYSTDDTTVPWLDVEIHAAEAEKLGYNVRRLLYSENGRGPHLVRDEHNYWAAIASLWDCDYLSSPGMIKFAW